MVAKQHGVKTAVTLYGMFQQAYNTTQQRHISSKLISTLSCQNIRQIWVLPHNATYSKQHTLWS